MKIAGCGAHVNARAAQRQPNRANSPLAVRGCADLESHRDQGVVGRVNETGVIVVGVVLNIEGKREPASIQDLIDLTAADMGRV
ncbi:MAG: hypothetical protein E5X90_10685, partial [Mesorhizobium sp.]